MGQPKSWNRKHQHRGDEMSHKDEAEETLGQIRVWASEEADLDKVVDLLYTQANIACAQVEATLALVDAQEARTEQARRTWLHMQNLPSH